MFVAPIAISGAGVAGALVQLPASLFLYVQAPFASGESKAYRARQYYHFALFDLQTASKFFIRGVLHAAVVTCVVASFYFCFTAATSALATNYFIFGMGLATIPIALSRKMHKDVLKEVLYLHLIKNMISERASNPSLARTVEEYMRILVDSYFENPEDFLRVFDTSTMWKFSIRRDELLKEPESIIQSLALDQMQSITTPTGLRVNFEGEEGIDTGGPSRDFLSELFKNLARRASSEESATYTFKKTAEGVYPEAFAESPQTRFYYSTADDVSIFNDAQISELLQFAYPDSVPQEFYTDKGDIQKYAVKKAYETIRARVSPLTPEEERGFQVIGKLLAVSQKDKKLPIGQIFTRSFYETLLCLRHVELNKRWQDVADETKLNLYKAKNCSTPTITKIFQILEAKSPDHVTEDAEKLLTYAFCDGDYPSEFCTEQVPDRKKIEQNFSAYQTALRTALIERAQVDKSLVTTYTIAQSMASCYSDTEWNALRLEGSENLSRTIQGILSKENIKGALSFENGVVDPFFMKWLDDATKDELIDFVKAVTGAPALSVLQKIKIITCGEKHALPSFHTCFVEIHRPQYATYEIFKSKLDTAIQESIPAGFTTA